MPVRHLSELLENVRICSSSVGRRKCFSQRSYDRCEKHIHTGNPLGFVDARRKSPENMLKSLEILGNIRAICGANLGNRQGLVDHDWEIIGNVLMLWAHTGNLLACVNHRSKS